MFSVMNHPKVIVWHYSGKFYYGSRVDEENNRSGEGVEYLPGRYVYIGQFYKGKKHGTGKIQTEENGNIYEGQWVDNSKHGSGKFY